jgi:hypothetical protein
LGWVGLGWVGLGSALVALNWVGFAGEWWPCFMIRSILGAISHHGQPHTLGSIDAHPNNKTHDETPTHTRTHPFFPNDRYELTPGGGQVVVTPANVHEYLRLVTRHLLVDSVAPAVEVRGMGGCWKGSGLG